MLPALRSELTFRMGASYALGVLSFTLVGPAPYVFFTASAASGVAEVATTFLMLIFAAFFVAIMISLPVFLAWLVVANVFATSVAHRPGLWSAAAVASVSVLSLPLLPSLIGMLLAVFPALVAALCFLFLNRLEPLKPA